MILMVPVAIFVEEKVWTFLLRTRFGETSSDVAGVRIQPQLVGRGVCASKAFQRSIKYQRIPLLNLHHAVFFSSNLLDLNSLGPRKEKNLTICDTQKQCSPYRQLPWLPFA